MPIDTINKYFSFFLDIQRYQRYIKSDFVGNLHIILPYLMGYDDHPYWLIIKLEYIKDIIATYFKSKEVSNGKKK